MSNRFTLYSRPGCHLCEEMMTTLQDIGAGNLFQVDVVNIDKDPVLQHLYGARIPVLVSAQDDRVISEHFLDKKVFLDSLK